LNRADQAKFRAMLLARDPHVCAVCGRAGVPLQAHHITVTDGVLLCQGCHNRETQANQFNGDPPPAA
jgi:hypothetical protein